MGEEGWKEIQGKKNIRGKDKEWEFSPFKLKVLWRKDQRESWKARQKAHQDGQGRRKDGDIADLSRGVINSNLCFKTSFTCK